VLALGRADRLPNPPARLQLTRLALAPGAGSDTFTAAGPILFYAVEGTTTVYVRGQPTSVGPGASALVQLGQLYALANGGAMPATLLRLAVAPRDASDVPVGNVIHETPIPRTPVSGPPTSAQLVRGDLVEVPPAPSSLFLACLRWEAAEADLGYRRHPGPVGLRVEQGALLVDEGVTLPEAGCALFQRDGPHRLRAGDPLPVLLLFGAVPEGQDLWPTGASNVGPSEAPVRCGPP
jgi:quercetin dioxygenase-like cupin family protein